MLLWLPPMLRFSFVAFVGLAVAAGCGASSVDSSSDGDGGEPGGGTDAGGSSGTGSGGTSTGGAATGGASSGGSSTGGNATGGNATGGSATGGSATGGSATGGRSTGGAAGLAGTSGTAGIAGTGGSVTTPHPDCPARMPENGLMCLRAGLRCAYDQTGCLCMNVQSDRCYQTAACAAMSEADRVAPPPVDWCMCTSPTDDPLSWDCAAALE